MVLLEKKIMLLNVVGDVLCDANKEERVSDAVIAQSRGRELLITAGELGCLVVRNLSSLKVLRFIPPPSTVRPGPLLSVAITVDKKVILAGTGSSDGLVIGVYGRDRNLAYAKKKNVSTSQIILSVGRS